MSAEKASRNISDWPGTPDRVLMTGHHAAIELAETVRNARIGIKEASSSLAGLRPAIHALARIEALLRRPLRLALLGEFNSGKSTLANLLVANAPLPTLQISNTRIPTLLHYAAEPAVKAVSSRGLARSLTAAITKVPDDTIRFHVGLPIASLKACEIIDFPGFADPWLSYGILDISRHPVDAALWCTFSTQAWKESESTAWRILPPRVRKYGMLAITSGDLLAEDQRLKVMARVQKVAAGDFREFALFSALQGRKAVNARGEICSLDLWRKSGSDGFCDRLQRLLSAIRRQRLEKARHLTSSIAGSALKVLDA
jgi:hypothetical protein